MTYNWADDARKSYDVGILAMREARIRSGEYAPRPDNPDELRWASEGPLPRRSSSRAAALAGGRDLSSRPPALYEVKP